MTDNIDSQSNQATLPSGGYTLLTGGLRRNILTWMLTVALVPLLVMSYQGYHCARHAIVQGEEASLTAILASRNAWLTSWLAERTADIDRLADTAAATACCTSTDPSHTAPCPHLKQVKNRNMAYDMIGIYDRTWQPLAATGPASQPASHEFTPDFMHRLETASGTLISPPHIHPDGQLGVHLGTVIKSADGKATGYVVANLNLSRAFEPILSNRSGLGKTGKVYLVSPDGRYASTAATTTARRLRPGQLPAGMLTQGTASVLEYRNSQGNAVLGVAAVIPDLGWMIVAEKHQAEAFAWLKILQRRALLTGLATLAAVLLLSLRTAKALSYPFRALAEVSRLVAAGQQSQRVGRLPGREAKEVARAFNQMLDQIAESQAKLVHAASLAAVGQLTSSIVHEMRNPLSSIKLNLSALRKTVDADPLHAELGDIALRQAGRLERMLQELLAYGKPLEIHPEAVSLKRLLAEALELVAPAAKARNTTFSLDWHGLEQASCSLDKEQMLRALNNLLLNAVQASPQNGQVTISLKRRPARPGYLEISIRDEGTGIPRDLSSRLFEPFVSTREDGTGLGLANVKKIVEYHKGQIACANHPEGGASFTLRLPYTS